MTPEERAKRALRGFDNIDPTIFDYDKSVEGLTRIISEAVAEEREACAKIAEPKECSNSLLYDVRVSIAQAIRARGEK